MAGPAPEGHRICNSCQTAIRVERDVCPVCGRDPSAPSSVESIQSRVARLSQPPSLQPYRIVSLALAAVGLVCGLFTAVWWGAIAAAIVTGFVNTAALPEPHPGYYEGTIRVTSRGLLLRSKVLAQGVFLFGIALPIFSLLITPATPLTIAAIGLTLAGLLVGLVRLYRIHAFTQGFESQGVPT